MHDCDYECVAHPASRGGHGSDSAGIVPSIHSQVFGERSEDDRCLQHLHDELFVRSIDFPKVGDFDHLPAHIIDSTKAIILAVASPSFLHNAPLCEGGEDARCHVVERCGAERFGGRSA